MQHQVIPNATNNNQPEINDIMSPISETETKVRKEMQMAICIRCGEFFPDARKGLGFDKCIPCNTQYAQARGEQIKRQSAPMNKSNYQYISSPDYLRQLNPKRTV
jgi:hypothetical protein